MRNNADDHGWNTQKQVAIDAEEKKIETELKLFCKFGWIDIENQSFACTKVEKKLELVWISSVDVLHQLATADNSCCVSRGRIVE